MIFQHDMAYGDFKDLNRRTVDDKVLRDKAFNIAKNPKYDGYQRGIVSMGYKFFDKKTSGGDATRARSETLAARNKSAIKNENISNVELAEELHKAIIRKANKKSTLTFYKQYLGCRFSRYATDK